MAVDAEAVAALLVGDDEQHVGAALVLAHAGRPVGRQRLTVPRWGRRLNSLGGGGGKRGLRARKSFFQKTLEARRGFIWPALMHGNLPAAGAEDAAKRGGRGEGVEGGRCDTRSFFREAPEPARDPRAPAARRAGKRRAGGADEGCGEGHEGSPIRVANQSRIVYTRCVPTASRGATARERSRHRKLRRAGSGAGSLGIGAWPRLSYCCVFPRYRADAASVVIPLVVPLRQNESLAPAHPAAGLSPTDACRDPVGRH